VLLQRLPLGTTVPHLAQSKSVLCCDWVRIIDILCLRYKRHRYVSDVMTSASLSSSISSQQDQERKRLRLAESEQLVERCVCVCVCDIVVFYLLLMIGFSQLYSLFLV